MLRHISTAAFVRLIFLKDVRALRYPLLLLLALAITAVLLPLNPDQTEFWTLTPVLAGIFVGLGAFLLMIPVIQSDPAGREFRFLLTRPVPGSAIGLAKALFLIVFLMIPSWAFMEFIVAYARVPLSALDHFLLFVQTVIFGGAVLAFLVLLCVFLRNGLHVVLALVILRFVGSWGYSYLFIWWQAPSWHGGVLAPPNLPELEHERLAHFCTLLGNAVFLGVALFAIVLRYRTKSFGAPLILALGGFALSQLALLCPYNFAQGLEEQSSNRSMLTPEQLGRIKMTLVTEKGHQHPYDLAGGSWNGNYYVNLNQSVQFEGLELPYFFQTVGYHAVITLRSGKTITSDSTDFLGLRVVGGLNPPGGSNPSFMSFMAVVAGVLPSWPYQKEQELDLLTYLPRNLPDEDITGATVKGVITLDVRRAYIAGSIPLRPGATFGLSRRSYEIAHTEFSKDKVSFDLNCYQLPLILRGDLATWNTKDDLQWLAIYRPYGESLAQQQSSGGGGFDFWLHVNQPKYTYKSVDKYLVPGWRPLPPDWASGAELVFIGSDPCGQVTLPYEIDNVDLNYRF